MPRCRAAMTRLPSNDGAAARAPTGRFNTDVSLDAKVTGGTISFGGRGDYHGHDAAAVGAARSAAARRKRGRLGGEHITATDFGFNKALRRGTAQGTHLFTQPRNDRGHRAIGVARPRAVERFNDRLGGP